jgi:hypothetical protein
MASFEGSQALDAGSIPVTRSITKAQVTDCSLLTWAFVVAVNFYPRAVCVLLAGWYQNARRTVVFAVIGLFGGTAVALDECTELVGDGLVYLP